MNAVAAPDLNIAELNDVFQTLFFAQCGTGAAKEIAEAIAWIDPFHFTDIQLADEELSVAAHTLRVCIPDIYCDILDGIRQGQDEDTISMCVTDHLNRRLDMLGADY